MEYWKDIEGFEGMYQVSSEGRVRSLDRINSAGNRCRGQIRRLIENKNGYLYVNLCKNGKPVNYLVHRLVANAFVENPDRKQTVNHINEQKHDNRAVNLEWMTLPENLNYGTHTERANAHRLVRSGTLHSNFGKRGSETNTHKGKVIGVSKTDPNIVVEFDTAATASRALHISSGQLCDAINGKAKSCGGYYWRRVNG